MDVEKRLLIERIERAAAAVMPTRADANALVIGAVLRVLSPMQLRAIVDEIEDAFAGMLPKEPGRADG